MDISLFLRGLVIGFSIAAPVGPIGVLCIRRTLAESRLVGFLSGVGAASADCVYGAVAAFGLAALSDLLLQQQFLLRLVGSLFLVFLGMRTFFSKPATMSARSVAHPSNLLSAYFSTFLLTITNPMTILSFLAIFAGLGAVSKQDNWSGFFIVLGVFCGSVTWWFLLSFLAGMFQKYLEGARLAWVNRFSGIIILAFAVSVLYGLVANMQSSSAAFSGSVLIGEKGSQPAAAASVAGYTRADGKRTLTFPDDFGAHLDYQTEWWYYTGNLKSPNGKRFGFQLTFFRRAIQPPMDQTERTSDWATNQVYLAHFAITDAAANQHYSFERLERGAAELAGASASPFRVWLDDWQVTQTELGVYHLQASIQANANQTNQKPTSIALDLVLTDAKGPVLQGKQGYSQKGSNAGNASYYYSLTHLVSSGTISIDGSHIPLSGSAWMDHEFSTSALSPDQVGWDWFSIQLSNDQELMLFQLRKADGTVDKFSSGALIDSAGHIENLESSDFQIQVLSTWRSPRSGAVYPGSWQINIPKKGISLKLTPIVADQELNLRYKYWEGAVDIHGNIGPLQVNGVGYVELTGYAGSMAGEF